MYIIYSRYNVVVQPRGLVEFLSSDAKVPVNDKDLLTPRNNLEAATNEAKQHAIQEKLNHFMVSAEAGLDRFIQHWDLEQKLNFKINRDVRLFLH